MSVPEAAPESCFVDTNIWLYAFIEGEERQKTARAKELLEASRTIIVSTQVINEVCVNLLKKAQFVEQQIQRLIESFYAKYMLTVRSFFSGFRKFQCVEFWSLMRSHRFMGKLTADLSPRYQATEGSAIKLQHHSLSGD
jgi:hypothetical protein